MTEAGPIDMMDLDEASDNDDMKTVSLPGVKKGNAFSFLQIIVCPNFRTQHEFYTFFLFV